MLIHFDLPTKKRILDRMASKVEDPGSLDAAQSVLGVTDAFKPVSDFRGLYTRDASRVGARLAAEQRIQR